MQIILSNKNKIQAGAELCQAQGMLCLVRLLLTYLIWIVNLAHTFEFAGFEGFFWLLWYGRFGLVRLVWQVWFGRFGQVGLVVGLVWQVWLGMFGLVGLVWYVWFGMFGLVCLVWQGWFGQVWFGLLGTVNLVITSYYCKFQNNRKPATYFSGRVGRTAATVIIELPQSSLTGTRLSLAKKRCRGKINYFPRRGEGGGDTPSQKIPRK